MRDWWVQDTIAAIATPRGKGGIGVVKVSGPLCQEIAGKVFRPARGNHPLVSHRFYYGYVVDPEVGRPIDEAMCCFMRSPRTYTRQDCLELQVHSGAVVTQEVLEAVLASGARLAGPGEFTLRAFLNGRIDLLQAEAVVDLIEARSRAARRMAVGQMGGGLSREARCWKERVLEALVLVEAAIDFPEEEVPEVSVAQVRDVIVPCLRTAEALLGSYERGRLSKEGASVMIVGPVNVGKSSLLNAIVGFERAVVTDLPGTTRDLVEEQVEWKGLPIRAIDTAGIREGGDEPENVGRRLLRERVQGADLLLVVLDGSSQGVPGLGEVEEWVRERPSIVVLNKRDLGERLCERKLPQSLRGLPVVRVSALRREGIDILLDVIKDLLLGSEEEELVVGSLRQKLALERFVCALRRVEEMTLREGGWWELLAEELRGAMDSLDELLGYKVDEDVLGMIFSRFCVGK